MQFPLLGLIGIIVSLVLFLILVYKGWHTYWVAFLCAIIVALTNGLFWNNEGGFAAAYETFTGAYANGMIELFGTMLWVIMLGAILGKLYEDSGMTYSIFNFMNRFINRTEGKQQIHTAYLWLFIMGGLLSLGGIDPYVQLFIMVPICAILCERLDIPRRLIPGMTCLFTCFVICPGAPNIYNIMANAGIASVLGEQITGQGPLAGRFDLFTSSTSGLVVGILGVIIVAVAAHFFMVSFTMKAKANGEHFEWGSMRPVAHDADRQCPNIILSLIPLVAVFVLYAIVGAHISIALSVGIILTILFGLKYLPMQDQFGNPIGRGKALLQSMNTGAVGFPNALMTVITPAALAGVITATAAFGAVIGVLQGINMAPVLLCAIATMILVAITSSPPAALMIALPMTIGVLLGQTRGTLDGVNVHALMRIAVMAAATFETLPFNGMVLLNMDLAHTTHKEAYKPVGMISVCFTFVAMVVGVILYMAIPMLP